MKTFQFSCGLRLMAVLFVAWTVGPGWFHGTSRGQDKGEPKRMSVMLQPWTGPYGGVPPWNLVRPDEFVAAFETAITQAIQEIDAIADQPDPPTFANTLVALESAGRTLDRLQSLFGVHRSNLNVDPIPGIERVVMPKLAEYEDRVTQHARLFARIAAVYEGDEYKKLSVAQQRLVEDRYKDFVRRGAKLSAGDKAQLSQINQRLASLFTEFGQNVMDDEKNYVTWIDKREDLAGLPDSIVAAMASAAKERGKAGQWAVTNTRSAMDPFLTYARNRALREKVWRTYYSRGDNGDQHDNNGIIAEIVKLRAARARLLGFPTHAHWRLEPQMAKTPAAAMELMMKVWPKAVARVREEVADMQKIADAEGQGVTIEPWDYRYYAEKVRKAKYDLDLNEVKPYLQLEKLRDGMLWAAGQSVRLAVQTHPGRAGVPSRCPRVGSNRRRGKARGIMVSRSLRPRRETQRGLDDDVPFAREHGYGHHADHLEQLELHSGRTGRADSDFLG